MAGVWTNVMQDELVQAKPTTLQALEQLQGFNKARIEKFGKLIIQRIRDVLDGVYSPNNPPSAAAAASSSQSPAPAAPVQHTPVRLPAPRVRPGQLLVPSSSPDDDIVATPYAFLSLFFFRCVCACARAHVRVCVCMCVRVCACASGARIVLYLPILIFLILTANQKPPTTLKAHRSERHLPTRTTSTRTMTRV